MKRYDPEMAPPANLEELQAWISNLVLQHATDTGLDRTELGTLFAVDPGTISAKLSNARRWTLWDVMQLVAHTGMDANDVLDISRWSVGADDPESKIWEWRWQARRPSKYLSKATRIDLTPSRPLAAEAS